MWKQDINKKKGGFTIIELLVVIAIIAVLAGIVMVGVGSIRKKLKSARVKTEMTEITRAMQLFVGEHGSLPGEGRAEYSPGMVVFEGETPYSVINGTTHYLSEFYNLNWADASYFCNGCYYIFQLYDGNNDGTKGCGWIYVWGDNPVTYYNKVIICDDCKNLCGQSTNNVGL